MTRDLANFYPRCGEGVAIVAPAASLRNVYDAALSGPRNVRRYACGDVPVTR